MDQLELLVSQWRQRGIGIVQRLAGPPKDRRACGLNRFAGITCAAPGTPPYPECYLGIRDHGTAIDDSVPFNESATQLLQITGLSRGCLELKGASLQHDSVPSYD